MRQVAVTEGDKVEAQQQFGYAVNGYGTGDLVNAPARSAQSIRKNRGNWAKRVSR